MAIAVSAAPSEAAKKKRMKGPATGTYIGQVCSTGCTREVMVWGADSKWSPAFSRRFARAVLPGGLLSRSIGRRSPSKSSLPRRRGRAGCRFCRFSAV